MRIRDTIGAFLFGFGTFLQFTENIVVAIIGSIMYVAGAITLFFPQEEKDDA